jgi:hypothetical protein
MEQKTHTTLSVHIGVTSRSLYRDIALVWSIVLGLWAVCSIVIAGWGLHMFLSVRDSIAPLQEVTASDVVRDEPEKEFATYVVEYNAWVEVHEDILAEYVLETLEESRSDTYDQEEGVVLDEIMVKERVTDSSREVEEPSSIAP